MFKPFQFCLLGIITLLVVACVDKSNSENVGDYLDSSVVTQQVKAKLVEQLGSQGFSIKVKVYHDEVLLSGVVENETTQHKAGQIAASVMNVRHVRNDVVVGRN